MNRDESLKRKRFPDARELCCKRKQLQAARRKGGFAEQFLAKRRRTDEEQSSVNGSINILPDEVLLYIFKYVSPSDVATGVLPVCRRWHHLAPMINRWQNIRVGPEVSTYLLVSWLIRSPDLKVLELRERTDTNEILATVIQYDKNIEHLKLFHCRGSEFQAEISSDYMCTIVNNFLNIKFICCIGTEILDRKFFQLLVDRRNGELLTHSQMTPITYIDCHVTSYATTNMSSHHMLTVTESMNSSEFE